MVAPKASTNTNNLSLLTRRRFLSKTTLFSVTAVTAPALLIPKVSLTPANEPVTGLLIPQTPGEQAISMYNIHTGEYLKNCCFWVDGKFNPEALNDFRRFFRDHRTNEEIDVDPDLLRLLHQIIDKLETTQEIHLISGYRSSKSNKMLRAKSCGVAENSQHLYGKAADIAIPGRTMKQIQAAAKSLKAGGVGRYANFVHVDTGRVRYWGPA